jgi:hypothetical protein
MVAARIFQAPLSAANVAARYLRARSSTQVCGSARRMQCTSTRERATTSSQAHAHTHTHKQKRTHARPSHHPGIMQKTGISRCSAQTRASGLAGAEGAKAYSRNTRTRTAASSTERTHSPASKSSRHHAENPASRHSKCSAHARASGRVGSERAKAPLAQRPAISQHRVGRRRRGRR